MFPATISVKGERKCYLKLSAKRCETHETDEFGHLDLCEYTPCLIVLKARCIANGECVGPFYRYLSRFARVELSHSLHFGESHKVSIFETMTRLI